MWVRKRVLSIVSKKPHNDFSSTTQPTDFNDVIEQSINKKKFEEIFGANIFTASFETLEGIFTDIQEAAENFSTTSIRIKRNLTPILKARQMLSPSLSYPKSIEDALKFYFANWHPYLNHISPENRSNKAKKLGWGVKVCEDVPKGIYLCGYEGVRYISEKIDENLRKRYKFLYVIW